MYMAIGLAAYVTYSLVSNLVRSFREIGVEEIGENHLVRRQSGTTTSAMTLGEIAETLLADEYYAQMRVASFPDRLSVYVPMTWTSNGEQIVIRLDGVTDHGD